MLLLPRLLLLLLLTPPLTAASAAGSGGLLGDGATDSYSAAPVPVICNDPGTACAGVVTPPYPPGESGRAWLEHELDLLLRVACSHTGLHGRPGQAERASLVSHGGAHPP